MPIPPTKTARKLRQRAEEKLALIDATNAEKLSPEDTQRLFHELQVYKIELEMQNEELRGAIAEKEAIQGLYIDLYENAPAGYFSLDRDAKIQAVNITGADLLGIERALLINNRFDTFISDETRPAFHEFLDKVFASKVKETCEVAIETEHLSTLFIQIYATVTESGKNCRVVVIDITSRKQTEEKLDIAREGLQQFSGETDAILSSMLDAVLVYNADMNVVRVNPGFFSVYGFDPIGMNVREIIVKTHCRNHDGTPFFFDQQPTPRALTGEKVLNQLFIITRLDGQERILETSSCPMYIGEQIAGTVTVWHDITARNQAEEALVESKQKIQNIVDNTPALVYALDLEERFVLVNASVAKVLNSTPSHIIGRRRHDFMPQADADWHEANDRKVIEAGEALEFEEHNELPDRSIVWLTTKFPLRNVEGKIYAVGGISTDITERKQTETALRESQERLTLAADAGQIGIFDLNMATGDLQWTHLHEIIFGYEPTTTTTTTTARTYRDWADRVHPDDLSMVEDRMRQSLEERVPFQVEYRLVWPDNTLHWVNVASKYFFDDSGHCTRLTGAVRDITDQKLAEVQLKRMNEELEIRVTERTHELTKSLNMLRDETAARFQATETLREKERMLIQQSRQAAMGEMIGNIAHQWRQPLNTLGLYMQKLGVVYGMPNFNKEFLDNSIAKTMEIIMHMSKTIDDFSNYFKPDREKADFCANEAVKRTLSLLEGNFHSPNITVEFIEHDNLIIKGYQNEYAQVFLNILNNARDAIVEREIADPRIIITISYEDSRAVVTVADNAGGIPDEFIDRVFDPYFTTKGPQVGTGIGLFMSKTIIEKNMGGRLTVRNAGTGAEFRIEVEHGAQN